MIRRAWSWVKNAFFPRLCVRCGVEGEEVCSDCLTASVSSAVVLYCPTCEKVSPIGARCLSCKGALDGLIYSMPYADPVTRGLIGRWKYDGVRGTEPYLRTLIERAPLAEILGSDGWTVVPVSLHPARRRYRGFDQSAWIARTVSDLLSFPAGALIQRVKKTAPQARTEHEKRRKGDLAGTFRAKRVIEGRVLLCDDVYTSGATMQAAAEACRQAGATSVWGFTIAKG